MRSPIRIVWRSATMGVKLDECAACGKITPHRVVRQYRWLEVGPLGVLPLGIRHGLECGDCWAFTSVPMGMVRTGVRTRTLPLPNRPRPLIDAARARGERTPEVDRVVPSGGIDGGTFYLGAWIAIVLIAVGLAAQPVGTEGQYSSSASCLVVVGLTQGQPVPTPPVMVSATLCVLPHNFEPLAKIPLASSDPSATIPPYSLVAQQAAPACAAALKDAFGAQGTGGLVTVITGPDPRDWGRGEHFTWCAALDPANPWRTSSLR